MQHPKPPPNSYANTVSSSFLIITHNHHAILSNLTNPCPALPFALQLSVRDLDLPCDNEVLILLILLSISGIINSRPPLLTSVLLQGPSQ